MNNFKDYYILAESYCVSAKSLFQIIIDNENEIIGFGKTEQSAEKQMNKLHETSDATLFIPALFLSFHSVELFAKGLLKMNNIEFSDTHDLSTLLEQLKKIYAEKSDVIKSISRFNKNIFDKLKEFKNYNKITNVNEIYEALRYPNNKSDKIYEHFFLKYNFDNGINYCKTLIKNLNKLRESVVEEKNKYYEKKLTDCK